MLLKNGRVVRKEGVKKLDVRIKGEEITELADNLDPASDEKVMDLEGKLVFPGLIGSHTHFQLDARGAVAIDDFFHGSISAAYGGITSFIDYADQGLNSVLAGLRERQAQAESQTVLDYNLHLVINNDFEPEKHLSEIYELPEAGVSSLKIFTTYENIYMLSEDKLASLFQAAAETGLVITVHSEDNDLVTERESRHVAEGKTGINYHPDIRPALAEKKAIEKMAELSRRYGAKLYIVHLSSRLGLEAAAEARKDGTEIYIETAPHYLMLTREKLNGPQGELNFMTPPLREKEDNQALWKGLADGLIDVVATDHCAFTPQQKSLGSDSLDKLPGIPGVETMLPLLYTYGVKEGRFDLNRLIELLAVNPAQIFGLYPRKGSIKEGTDADLVVYDPEQEWVLSGDQLHSLSGYTPFSGIEVKGKIVHNIVRGETVIKDGQFTGDKGYGRFIRAKK